FNMTSDHNLREPCRKAVEFIVKAEGPDGGWRYTPGWNGDMSVASWNLMALKSGQMSGLRVPEETLKEAGASLHNTNPPDGGYTCSVRQPGHSPPMPGPMTAAGIVGRHYLQSESSANANRLAGVDVILKNRVDPKRPNFYYFYYSMYALFPVGGEPWRTWN